MFKAQNCVSSQDNGSESQTSVGYQTAIYTKIKPALNLHFTVLLFQNDIMGNCFKDNQIMCDTNVTQLCT